MAQKKTAQPKKRPIESYEHRDKKRVNNPPVGLVTPDTDPDVGAKQTYAYDPHLDPQLQWAGKVEHTSFDVPTVSLHVHERIDPRTIIEAVRKRNGSKVSALEQNSYTDAKQMLLDFEKWLRSINESAADSLREALEEVLTLHRLKVTALLRKTLISTNPIENMFSTVRDCEINIKRYRSSAMSQRWLAAVLLHCENGFRRIKGYGDIVQLLKAVDQYSSDQVPIAA